jgi:hypothetical protein
MYRMGGECKAWMGRARFLHFCYNYLVYTFTLSYCNSARKRACLLFAKPHVYADFGAKLYFVYKVAQGVERLGSLTTPPLNNIAD